jgi:hypothetical protein
MCFDLLASAVQISPLRRPRNSQGCVTLFGRPFFLQATIKVRHTACCCTKYATHGRPCLLNCITPAEKAHESSRWTNHSQQYRVRSPIWSLLSTPAGYDGGHLGPPRQIYKAPRVVSGQDAAIKMRPSRGCWTFWGHMIFACQYAA